MKSSRVPILINLPKDLERVEILLAADIHTGSAEFDEKKWGQFEELLKRPDTYVIFAGDQCEYATRSSKSDVYTQALSPSQQKRWWIEHLKAYKEKVLCIVDGFDGIDVFVSGHTHKPMDRPSSRLVYDPKNKCVAQRDIENIVSGHFLRFGGYGERGGYKPTSTKLYSVILHGKKPKAIETRGFHL